VIICDDKEKMINN